MDEIKIKVYCGNFDYDICSNWRANFQYNGQFEGLNFTFCHSSVDYYDDMNYDVIILSRPLIHFIDYIKLIKEAGKKVIVDYDDTFPMLFDSRVKTHIIECLNIIDEVDLVTTTNESLKTYFYNHTFRDNVVVLPNIINSKFVDNNKRFHSDKVVLGWYGSGIHYDNLKIIHEPVLKVLNEYQNVYLNLYSSCEKSNALFNHEKVNVTNFVYNFNQFQENINDIDINLAPLSETFFNFHKSNIRIIVAGYKGIPSIASNFGEYKAIGKDRILVADSSEDWYNNMKLLINDMEKRNYYGQQIQNYVRENLMFENWVDKKIEILKKVISRLDN